MALHQLTLEDRAIDVAFSMSGTRLAVLSNTGISVYALDLNRRPVPPPSMLWRSDALAAHCPRHVSFIGDEQIYVLTDSWDEEESFLWASNGQELLLKGPILEADTVSSIIPSVDVRKLFVPFRDGTVREVILDEQPHDLPLQMSLVVRLSSPAPDLKVSTLEGQVRCLI